MPRPPLKVFALQATRELGEAIARHLGAPLAAHEEREFEDGEHKARPLESVRDCDVAVVQSLHGDAHHQADSKLVRLLFFIAALKDAGAARVTAITPYLCYARKDRRTKPRDPVSLRYLAALFEAVRTDCVVTLDVHDLAAFQNAFRCRTEHLEATRLFADYLTALGLLPSAVVVSPDAGGVKRAERLREVLAQRAGRDVGLAFLEKKRSRGAVSGEAVVGALGKGTAIVLDDIIASGTTMVRAARACRAAGAERVFALATHGLFVGDAAQHLASAVLDGIVVCNTVPPARLPDGLARARLTVLNAAPLLAEAIRRLHEGGSLVALMED